MNRIFPTNKNKNKKKDNQCKLKEAIAIIIGINAGNVQDVRIIIIITHPYSYVAIQHVQ